MAAEADLHSDQRKRMRDLCASLYVLLPATLGAFTFGGMVGVWIGVNIYYSATTTMVLWGLGAALIVALEDR
jgi:hypothetical protein